MNIEKMKKKIIELIDESKDNERKLAFYSDDKVTEILDKLYREWEKNNRVGIPLDYASREEIETLYNLAVKYSKTPRGKVYSKFIEKAYRGREREEEDEHDKNKKTILRKIFGF